MGLGRSLTCLSSSAIEIPPVGDVTELGVRELGRGLSLAREPGAEGRVVRELGREDLDRHEPLEPEVAGPIDDGHAASADLVLDLILMAQRFGDAVAEG